MQLDLHCHTKYSFDCSMSPKKVVRLAKARGVDAIAITDHNEVAGAYEARDYGKQIGIEVVIGEEITTKAGDILGLFIKDRIKTYDPFEAIDEIKRQGGIAIMPHPFSGRVAIDERVVKRLHGCEGYNARHSKLKEIDNSIGEPDVVDFARQYKLVLTAGSDAHFYPDVARARTIVSASTLEEARQAILAGHTVLSGRRSISAGRFASAFLRTLRMLLDPVPEAKE